MAPGVPLLWMVPTPISSRSFLLELPSRLDTQVQKPDSPGTGPALGTLEMLQLLLPLLWAGEWDKGQGSWVRGQRQGGGLMLQLSLCVPPGSLQKDPGYKLQVPESVTVQEGLCVLVPCTVTYPPADWNNTTPTHGYWFLKKNNFKAELPVATNKKTKKVRRKARFSFYFSGDPGDNNCSLSITDAQKSDSGKYYFRLERGPANHSFQNNLVTVDVTGMQWNDRNRPEGGAAVQGWAASLRGAQRGPPLRFSLLASPFQS